MFSSDINLTRKVLMDKDGPDPRFPPNESLPILASHHRHLSLMLTNAKIKDFPHLEGFANGEKVGILGEGVSKHAQLQRQLVCNPTHLIHPGLCLPFLKH